MKKIIILLLGTIFVSVSFATYQSNDTRRSPEYKTMNFQATLENNTVAMTWASFDLPAGHSFVYWKVMRSQKTDNPVYKEANSEYVKYDSNINFTWYTDKSPKEGTTRYRICAITKTSDGYHRYCSKEVKKITTTSSSEEEKYYEEKPSKEEIRETTYSITEAQKTVMDQLATEFLKKLDEKFGTNTTKKNTVLKSVISQLNNLGKKQVKMKLIVGYLVEKLEMTMDPLDEIKSILNIE